MAREQRISGMFSIGVVGAQDVARSLADTKRSVAREVEVAMLEVLAALEGRIKKRLSGEVLNKRTGTLFRSIHSRARLRGMDSSGVVGTPIVYGPPHEFGATITNGFGRGITIQIPKRPFVEPSFEELRSKIVQRFRRAVGKAVG